MCCAASASTTRVEYNVNGIPLCNGMATIAKTEIFTPFLQSRKVSLRGYVIFQKHKPKKGRVRLRVYLRSESDSLRPLDNSPAYGCHATQSLLAKLSS